DSLTARRWRGGDRFVARNDNGTASRRQELLDPDRQGAHAHAGRMIDGVGDGRRGAHIGELAQALDADRVDVAVFLGDEDHLDIGDIGVYRHAVVGEVVVDVARALAVDLG